MSLNNSQRRTSSRELRRNLELSGLSIEELAAEVGLRPTEVADTLQLSAPSSPAQVWAVRDQLERVIVAHGDHPLRYTYLSEEMRSAASTWFGVDAEPPTKPR